MLRAVFAHKQRTRWWLEETSTFFKVTAKANVLVRSQSMFDRFGASTVVFEFQSVSGRALHLMGHFWQEDGNLAGLVATACSRPNYEGPQVQEPPIGFRLDIISSPSGEVCPGRKHRLSPAL